MVDKILLRLSLLNIPRWGNATVHKLLSQVDVSELQNPDSILEAIKKIAPQDKRIKIPLLSEIEEAAERALNIADCCKEHDIEILIPEHKYYPRNLLRTRVPPCVLYAKGDLNVLNCEHIIAMIGTREPLDWIYQSIKRIGLRCAEKEIVVLSGLALGCDTAAHEGCLEIGGKAIGVLGCGLDTIYPKVSENLANSIIANNGCLVSEYPPETKTNKFQLVARDKLQAAMSNQVIVGQTTIEGGSMHAANYALDKLIRPVGVITRDKILDDSFSGNLQLIERGARPLIGSDTLVEFLKKKEI